MKKFLVALFLCIACTVSAQVLNYRTVRFYTSQNTSYGWTNWSNAQRSNMLLQMDLDHDLVYINSNSQQLYKIVAKVQEGYDNDGDYIREFKFIDQDGDRGIMKLVARTSGNCQVYIIFGNVRWCYDVVPL